MAGIKGGLFNIALNNVCSPRVGGDAGKVNGPQNYYSDIPEGLEADQCRGQPGRNVRHGHLDPAGQNVYACLNPLGDPGDPTKPISPTFFVPPASSVKCMQVGSNNLSTDLTTAFGPDNQPYFGGQRIVNSFDSQPGSSFKVNPVPSAWPQCTFNGFGGTFNNAKQLAASLAAVFNAHSANHCGNAQPNFGFGSALVTQPSAIISHVAPNGDGYMYTGPLGGTVDQFKVTVDPISGLSNYAFRTYLTGISLTTGLGIADDLQSLMVFTDPSTVGLAGQGVVTKLPLCEDM